MDPYLDHLNSIIKPKILCDRILTWHIPFHPRCAISTVKRIRYSFKTGPITADEFVLHMN